MSDVDLNLVAVPLDWSQLFGRPGPTDVEIGSGKGRFLLELAAADPARNLLAVERARKYHVLVCQRAAQRGLGNIRLLLTTAEDLLDRLLPPASVTRLFVLFPDPWPKKRHHKRRLMQPAAVAAMTRALVPGGQLLVKTDHPAYAEVIGECLAAAPGLAPLDAAATFADLPLTGFECKYLERGLAIHSWACERVARA